MRGKCPRFFAVLSDSIGCVPHNGTENSIAVPIAIGSSVGAVALFAWCCIVFIVWSRRPRRRLDEEEQIESVEQSTDISVAQQLHDAVTQRTRTRARNTFKF